jgi:hypothetical protein
VRHRVSKQAIAVFVSLLVVCGHSSAQGKKAMAFTRAHSYFGTSHLDDTSDFPRNISTSVKEKGVVTASDGVYRKMNGTISNIELLHILANDTIRGVELENMDMEGPLHISALKKSFACKKCRFKGDVSFDSSIVGSILITNSRFYRNINLGSTNPKNGCRIRMEEDTIQGTSSFKGISWSGNRAYNAKQRGTPGDVLQDPALTLVRMKYDSSVTFENADLLDGLSLEKSSFSQLPILENSKINGDLNLNSCNFQNGIDLRFLWWCRLRRISISNTRYPAGSVHASWDSLLATLDTPSQLLASDTADFELRHIEAMYTVLRDNYLIQNDKRSADQVMYHIAVMDAHYKPSLWKTLYNMFLGFGYKPWRWILYIIFPLMACGAAVLWRYYGHVNEIVRFGAMRTDMLPRQRLALRIVKCLYFSGSVMLGIRFRRMWISDDCPAFTYTVIILWLVGTASIIAMAALTKVAEFQVVKGLIGI